MSRLRSSTQAQLWFSVAAALFFAPAVNAQDNGIYIGGSAGDVSSDYDWDLDDADVDIDEDSAFKVIGGVRLFDPFAVEVNYVDLGETTADVLPGSGVEAGIDRQAVSVSAVGLFSLPLIDVFGRVGLARWESDPTRLFESLDSADGTDPTYGVGAQVRFGGISVRAEYESFDIDDNSTELASIGVTYTFF